MLWNPIESQAVQISDYFKIHKEIFDKMEIQVDGFRNSHDALSSTVAELYGKQLTDQDQSLIFNRILVFQNSVVDLNTHLESALLKA